MSSACGEHHPADRTFNDLIDETRRKQREMTSDVMERPETPTLETGDVIELTRHDDAVTALVLLAGEEAVILDMCDGSTPFVLRRDELSGFRRFEPAA